MNNWICNNCEADNYAKNTICEVCNSISPNIISFGHDIIDVSQPTRFYWEILNSDESFLIRKDEKLDISSVSELYLLVKENEYITLISKNNICVREEILKTSIQKPVIINFNANNYEVLRDDIITLSWEVKNATGCIINEIIDLPLVSNIEIIGDKENYHLKAINSSGISEETIKIKILERPIIDISAESYKIKKGNSTKLKWEIKNSSKISLIGFEDDSLEMTTHGSKIIKPELTTTYKFDVTALDNNTTFEQFVTVEVFEEGMINFFNADKQFVLQTMSVILSWETENAIKVEIEGIGDVELTGSVKVEPFADTKYKLIVTDQFGKIEKHIQIKILPLPLIEKIIAQTPNIVNENIISINMPDFSTVSNHYPNTIEFKEFDFSIKLDSKIFIPTPKFINLKYEMKRDSFIEKIQRIFDFVKKEFITKKNHKYVSKK